MAEGCGCWLGILDCAKLGCDAGLGDTSAGFAGCCCGWLGILDCAKLGSGLNESGAGSLGILAALIG